MINAADLARKVGVGLSLLRRAQISSFLRVATSKIVRIEEHRIDRIELSSFRFGDHAENGLGRLRCDLASPSQMERLFADWRDSLEERERHRRVYFDLGFHRCFFVFDESANKVAHLQFLLDYGDRERIKELLHWPIYRRYLGPDAAWQDWVYTFSDYRRRGVSLLATARVIEYCLDRGIKVLYSRRGAGNYASVRMADRLGYVRVSRVYHVQLLGQSRAEGFYIIRPTH